MVRRRPAGNLYLTFRLTGATVQREPAFEKQDIVKLGVVEDGVRKVKKMEVANRRVVQGRYEYQLRKYGGREEDALYCDENGNDWVREVELNLWGGPILH